jgi:hypothetical protein
VALLGGPLCYLVGLELLDPTAEILDRDDLTRNNPVPYRRVLASHVAWAALVGFFAGLAIAPHVGTLAWLATGLGLGAAAITGPFLSFVLGPPSLRFVLLGFSGNPLGGVLVVSRYLAGPLYTTLTVAGILGGSSGQHPSMVAIYAFAFCCITVIWALRRAGMEVDRT